MRLFSTTLKKHFFRVLNNVITMKAKLNDASRNI